MAANDPIADVQPLIHSVRMVRSLSILLVFALVSVPNQTSALSTVCSEPDRARVLAAVTVKLPTDDIQALEELFSTLAPQLGMTTWAVTSSEHGRLLAKDIGLQSPEVSVSIEASWEAGTNEAVVQLQRTCINDSLEPWEGYWSGFLDGLNIAKYEVVSAN